MEHYIKFTNDFVPNEHNSEDRQLACDPQQQEDRKYYFNNNCKNIKNVSIHVSFLKYSNIYRRFLLIVYFNTNIFPASLR